MKKILVAIDGHSSCGKSTMAKALARRLGYTYVDTGAMYRAITLFALRNGLFSEDGLDEARLEQLLPQAEVGFIPAGDGKPNLTTLCGEVVEEEIRGIEVAGHVSQIAALPFVRRRLVALQKAMGVNGGIVMDGRDIGTNVFPQAELKVFVTASAEVRAQRRFDELRAKGVECDLQEIHDNVVERDRIDSTRATDPLRQADDALLLDNSNMTREEQNELLWQWAQEAIRS